MSQSNAKITTEQAAASLELYRLPEKAALHRKGEAALDGPTLPNQSDNVAGWQDGYAGRKAVHHFLRDRRRFVRGVFLECERQNLSPADLASAVVAEVAAAMDRRR